MVRQGVMIRCSGLGKRYGSRWALRRVEIELSKGECLLVTGPNGAGKTTLLRLLAGLEAPSEGEVAASGTIGFAAPDLALYPNLTAYEHLLFAAALRRVEPRESALLERVGLQEQSGKPVGAYSTGMRSRLRLALAIQHQPAVLLLDEPTATLDEQGRQVVRDIIEEQRTRGCIVLATNAEGDREFGDLEVRLGA
ncbi:MAG: ABC transporter ATP-binding protein [Armatimonadota bacterium]